MEGRNLSTNHNQGPLGESQELSSFITNVKTFYFHALLTTHLRRRFPNIPPASFAPFTAALEPLVTSSRSLLEAATMTLRTSGSSREAEMTRMLLEKRYSEYLTSNAIPFPPSDPITHPLAQYCLDLSLSLRKASDRLAEIARTAPLSFWAHNLTTEVQQSDILCFDQGYRKLVIDKSDLQITTLNNRNFTSGLHTQLSGSSYLRVERSIHPTLQPALPDDKPVGAGLFNIGPLEWGNFFSFPNSSNYVELLPGLGFRAILYSVGQEDEPTACTEINLSSFHTIRELDMKPLRIRSVSSQEKTKFQRDSIDALDQLITDLTRQDAERIEINTIETHKPGSVFRHVDDTWWMYVGSPEVSWLSYDGITVTPHFRSPAFEELTKIDRPLWNLIPTRFQHRRELDSWDHASLKPGHKLRWVSDHGVKIEHILSVSSGPPTTIMSLTIDTTHGKVTFDRSKNLVDNQIVAFQGMGEANVYWHYPSDEETVSHVSGRDRLKVFLAAERDQVIDHVREQIRVLSTGFLAENVLAKVSNRHMIRDRFLTTQRVIGENLSKLTEGIQRGGEWCTKGVFEAFQNELEKLDEEEQSNVSPDTEGDVLRRLNIALSHFGPALIDAHEQQSSLIQLQADIDTLRHEAAVTKRKVQTPFRLNSEDPALLRDDLHKLTDMSRIAHKFEGLTIPQIRRKGMLFDDFTVPSLQKLLDEDAQVLTVIDDRDGSVCAWLLYFRGEHLPHGEQDSWEERMSNLYGGSGYYLYACAIDDEIDERLRNGTAYSMLILSLLGEAELHGKRFVKAEIADTNDRSLERAKENGFTPDEESSVQIQIGPAEKLRWIRGAFPLAPCTLGLITKSQPFLDAWSSVEVNKVSPPEKDGQYGSHAIRQFAEYLSRAKTPLFLEFEGALHPLSRSANYPPLLHFLQHVFLGSGAGDNLGPLRVATVRSSGALAWQSAVSELNKVLERAYSTFGFLSMRSPKPTKLEEGFLNYEGQPSEGRLHVQPYGLVGDPSATRSELLRKIRIRLADTFSIASVFVAVGGNFAVVDEIEERRKRGEKVLVVTFEQDDVSKKYNRSMSTERFLVVNLDEAVAARCFLLESLPQGAEQLVQHSLPFLKSSHGNSTLRKR